MLSNCFGADKQPEESLLVKVVDTWALVAGFLVQNGLKVGFFTIYISYGKLMALIDVGYLP